MLFGDNSDAAKQAVNSIIPRDLSNFNWTFIALLAVVFYIYWTEVRNKNWKAIVAGFSLYGVHWLYEIANAVIAKIFGYPLWAVSNESTSFVLLIGVSWELSMMFSIAGIIAYKMLPEDHSTRYFARGNFKGIPSKFTTMLSMSLLYAVFEIFLAATPAFIWVYPWWGAIPVFITTYVPFFIAAIYVPDSSPKFQKIFLASIWGAVVLCLAILIPCGVI